MFAHSHIHCCHGNATMSSVNDIKPFSLSYKNAKSFLVHCCRATKYFASLSKMRRFLRLHVRWRIFFRVLNKSRTVPVAARSKGMGLWPLACWDCGFESHWREWISVCFECCVLSGRGLCNDLITRPEESYRLWCVVVCDLETSWMRRPWPTGGYLAKKKSNLGLLDRF